MLLLTSMAKIVPKTGVTLLKSNVTFDYSDLDL